MRISSRTLRAAGVALLAAACDGTATVDGVLAPSALGGSGAGAPTGTATVASGITPLLGSWTRVASTSAGVLTEQTFVFGADGRGARSTTTRTALGIPLVVERQPFTWSAGAGVLLLRLPRPGSADALLRVSYRVLVDVGGTVLRLDGQDYRRTGG